ncbi:uncharacterized protein LOC120432383 [Culex pipiens pallens]|uniref:uncharacterized protein LOC120432383 n=1 Tax=Culex pipiens pallens TaxID=42434 RepID=UPI0019543BA0|nr:uncharacterized protein LOC120432383 [Culex pipiens pallens]
MSKFRIMFGILFALILYCQAFLTRTQLLKLHTHFEQCNAEFNVSSNLHFEEHAEHLDLSLAGPMFFKVLVCVHRRANFTDVNGDLIVPNMVEFLREDHNVSGFPAQIGKCVSHTGSPEEKMRALYTCASKLSSSPRNETFF